MKYHKITLQDCLSVATPKEKIRLSMIRDGALLGTLVKRWCDMNGYKPGGYLGNDKWDATKEVIK